MNYLKSITALILALIFVLSLSACGGKSQVSEPNQGDSGAVPDMSAGSSVPAPDAFSQPDAVDTPPAETQFKCDGRYIKGKNGEHFIDIENQGPTVMHYNGEEGEKIFEGLSDGDLIRISCTAIEESYPGSTEIYSLEIVSKGSEENLNENTVNQLRELGWIE